MSTTPVRIQLSRRKGFNLQEVSQSLNGLPAVKVCRPGVFGNPFTLEDAVDVHDCSRDAARRYAVGWFEEWITQPADHHDQTEMGAYGYLKPWRERLLARLDELRGKNLACFCPLPRHGEPDHCHAAVLLRLANVRCEAA